MSTKPNWKIVVDHQDGTFRDLEPTFADLADAVNYAISKKYLILHAESSTRTLTVDGQF